MSNTKYGKQCWKYNHCVAHQKSFENLIVAFTCACTSGVGSGEASKTVALMISNNKVINSFNCIVASENND